MQNVPILEISISALCLLAYVRYSPLLRTFGAKLPSRDGSDSAGMTWKTRDGAIFEEIETFFVKSDWVTFRHKFGTARVAISDFAESSRAQLIRSYQENHSLAILPLEDTSREVRPFEVEAA